MKLILGLSSKMDVGSEEQDNKYVHTTYLKVLLCMKYEYPFKAKPLYYSVLLTPRQALSSHPLKTDGLTVLATG